MVESLGYISAALESLGLNYEFDEWTSYPVPNTYWVGEINEVGDAQDGAFDTTLILTGITTESRLVLEEQKDKIRDEFEDGKTAILDSGSGIAVLYMNSFGIPTAVEGMKRIQINLNIKEWKVKE